MDLFSPAIPSDKFHPNYEKTLALNANGVRAVLNEWANGFVDRDGKFVQEFQTTYNSAFWELYLFAILKHLGIEVDFKYSSPDFVAMSFPLAIEAAIASHARNAVPEWEKSIFDIEKEDFETANTETIARFSNAFLKKSCAYVNKYKKLRHMQDRSYVIAISNFATPGFHLIGDVPMQRLLYDVWQEKQILKSNGSVIPVGLFCSEAYSHVSAVLYSAVATYGKARALSLDTGHFVFRAMRFKENVGPIIIEATKENYQESLTDGLKFFTNPYANVPANPEWFDDLGIRRFIANKNGGILVSQHPEGHLCMRTVINICKK